MVSELSRGLLEMTLYYPMLQQLSLSSFGGHDNILSSSSLFLWFSTPSESAVRLDQVLNNINTFPARTEI